MTDRGVRDHRIVAATGAGLRTYSGGQWHLLRTFPLIRAADGPEGEESFLAESERLGVLPEAQLMLKHISPSHYDVLAGAR